MDRKTDEALESAQFIFDNSDQYAKAYSRRIALEHHIKAEKSVQMIASSQPSISGKEMEAQASDSFRQKIYELEAAAYYEKRLYNQIKAKELMIEIYRTESANNRTLDRAVR
jgi:hypothetical protein